MAQSSKNIEDRHAGGLTQGALPLELPASLEDRFAEAGEKNRLPVLRLRHAE